MTLVDCHVLSNSLLCALISSVNSDCWWWWWWLPACSLLISAEQHSTVLHSWQLKQPYFQCTIALAALYLAGGGDGTQRKKRTGGSPQFAEAVSGSVPERLWWRLRLEAHTDWQLHCTALKWHINWSKRRRRRRKMDQKWSISERKSERVVYIAKNAVECLV